MHELTGFAPEPDGDCTFKSVYVCVVSYMFGWLCVLSLSCMICVGSVYVWYMCDVECVWCVSVSAPLITYQVSSYSNSTPYLTPPDLNLGYLPFVPSPVPLGLSSSPLIQFHLLLLFWRSSVCEGVVNLFIEGTLFWAFACVWVSGLPHTDSGGHCSSWQGEKCLDKAFNLGPPLHSQGPNRGSSWVLPFLLPSPTTT